MALKRLLRINNPHIAISTICYIACLFLPGYYIGDRFEPQAAYFALQVGWLGPLDGHFSWFANPLLLLALLSANRPRRSGILAAMGLILALTFVLYKKIIVSEAPTYSPIVSYGWGYALWVTSLAVLSVGQIIRARGLDAHRVSRASFATLGLFLASYLAYYSLGNNSIFAIHNERDRVFDARCASAGEHIFKKTNGATGIFFDPDWEWRIATRTQGDIAYKYIDGGGVMGSYYLRNGYIQFYETRDQPDTPGYVKYVSDDSRGSRSNHLESEYAVITEHPDIPRRLNISAATVTIKDRQDNSVLATAAFLIENESGRSCGIAGGSFSTSAFVMKVLGLSKKSPATLK